MKLERLGLLSILAATMASRMVHASPPLPQFSEVDPCIVACPAGDSLFRVVARHYWTQPSSGAWVQLDLCGCPEVRIEPSALYSVTDGCWVSRSADVQGIVDFPLRAGGICSDASIRVFADGVMLATRNAVASPDRDGDLVVDQADLARLNSRLGTTDPTADFDCDGIVSDGDVAIAQAHLGHSASTPVGVPEGASGVEVAMLGQNRPNPFTGRSTIFFRLQRRERVTLAVFDVGGREVATLLRDTPFGAGHHEIPFDGQGLATGIYVYRLQAGSFIATRRMALLR